MFGAVFILFIILIILMILDFFTTEYLIKLGGYERTYLKFVAGQPLKHALFKMFQIVVIFLIVFYFVPFFLNQSYSMFFGIIFLLAANLGYAYAQINNAIVISELRNCK